MRFVTFIGSKPLLHPRIVEMAQAAANLGVQQLFVTNGGRAAPGKRWTRWRKPA